MPVSPKQAKEHVNPEEKAALDAIIVEVDKQLPLVFQGGQVKISFPKGVTLSSRMAPRLQKAYHDAGWHSVSVNTDKGFITLDESRPYYGCEKD